MVTSASAFADLLDYDGGPARVKIIADYYEADDDCCGEVTGVSRGAALNGELNLPLGIAQGENQRYVSHNLVTRSNDRQWGITVNGDFRRPDQPCVERNLRLPQLEQRRTARRRLPAACCCRNA